MDLQFYAFCVVIYQTWFCSSQFLKIIFLGIVWHRRTKHAVCVAQLKNIFYYLETPYFGGGSDFLFHENHPTPFEKQINFVNMVYCLVSSILYKFSFSLFYCFRLYATRICSQKMIISKASLLHNNAIYPGEGDLTKC